MKIVEFFNYIDGLRIVIMNIVENEKLKFKEMIYVKLEYVRLVMLVFLFVFFWIYIIICLFSCFVVGRNVFFRYEYGEDCVDGC